MVTRSDCYRKKEVKHWPSFDSENASTSYRKETTPDTVRNMCQESIRGLGRVRVDTRILAKLAFVGLKNRGKQSPRPFRTAFRAH